ncbi:hypothetical protein LEP1GSC075_1454 [Leptospira interrogans str. Kito]|nr:hypothetical protein LEP1GSC075_1454 [Leptospira interrogans str. Kito]
MPDQNEGFISRSILNIRKKDSRIFSREKKHKTLPLFSLKKEKQNHGKDSTYQISLMEFKQIYFIESLTDSKNLALTTRTHENSTKLLTAEFTKKIVVLKKYRKFGIYCILKQDQNIQIFETI